MCRTASGAKDSFYVLQLAEGADDGEAGGLALKMQKKLGIEQPEMGELPPFMQFEFTEEERIEMGEVLAATDAMKRMSEECAGADRPVTCGPKPKQGVVGDASLDAEGYTFWCMGWMNTYNELQTELGADPRSVGRGELEENR